MKTQLLVYMVSYQGLYYLVYIMWSHQRQYSVSDVLGDIWSKRTLSKNVTIWRIRWHHIKDSIKYRLTIWCRWWHPIKGNTKTLPPDVYDHITSKTVLSTDLLPDVHDDIPSKALPNDDCIHVEPGDGSNIPPNEKLNEDYATWYRVILQLTWRNCTIKGSSPLSTLPQ